MISVADLLKDNRIPGNFFDFHTYVRGDMELGLLESRRGDRLIAIPDTLLAALYDGLTKETGQASRLVLFNCGKWWGKNFYMRFSESVAEYYGMPLAEMDMITFLQCLQECWKTHGWGKLAIDFAHQGRGLIVASTTNSPYCRKLENNQRPTGYLESGILTTFFSKLTGKELLAAQLSCESLGHDCNSYVIGLPDRLAIVETLVEEGLDRDAILQRLLA